MSKMRCQHYRETAFWGLRVSASCCLLVSDHSAFTTPSVLNHLPAADTVSDRTVAVQACDTFGSDGQDYWTGFKTGLDFRPFKGEGVESQYSPNEHPSVGKILTQSRFDSHHP